ncbi:MAG: toprim domain-containing protein [Candidatus Diapherotrites archaeon]|nr:toprim domain-containing protein [Candidatus Diapherotrites archaeon]
MLTTSPDHIIDLIREYSEEAPIVVEGKNDVAALNDLGIFSVVSVNAHGGPVGTIDFLAEGGTREIIILTDYDRRGEELHKRLAELALSAGIRVNDNLRKKLREVTHVRYVENLARIIRGEKIG